MNEIAEYTIQNRMLEGNVSKISKTTGIPDNIAKHNDYLIVPGRKAVANEEVITKIAENIIEKKGVGSIKMVDPGLTKQAIVAILQDIENYKRVTGISFTDKPSLFKFKEMLNDSKHTRNFNLTARQAEKIISKEGVGQPVYSPELVSEIVSEIKKTKGIDFPESSELSHIVRETLYRKHTTPLNTKETNKILKDITVKTMDSMLKAGHIRIEIKQN